MKTYLLLSYKLLFVTFTFAQSSQPLLSVSRFEGERGDQVATAVFSGFTNSKRVKMTDPETIAEIGRKGLETTIVKTPAYLITGRVNAVNFGNHSSTTTNGKSTYYHDCEVVIELKLTNVVTNETQTRMLSSSRSSTSNHNDAFLGAMQGLSSRANSYARERFPATLSILQILEESDRKGIVSFRAEGEGLSVVSSSTDVIIMSIKNKTRISIKHRYEVTRPDGTTRWIEEDAAEAKITKLEGSDETESKTAICSVTKGGEKLRDLWNKKATLVLVTTN
ncbi:hypothetical protein [Larkinella rosea]|uniref:Penicillin-binding protein activator LpoB n=1 Tax=Larkinella rosea TaxID=2025312 RepID=A0A3P1C2C3_9BACT|nr:hypothetical protein [Larkinella rosea]RRB07213.1 hypothetical protein EHT25_05375 [Larkinella rosea]